jgi:hypothetical protein
MRNRRERSSIARVGAAETPGQPCQRATKFCGCRYDFIASKFRLGPRRGMPPYHVAEKGTAHKNALAMTTPSILGLFMTPPDAKEGWIFLHEAVVVCTGGQEAARAILTTLGYFRLRLTRAKFLWTKTDQAYRHGPTRLSVSLSFAEASCTQLLE